MSAGQVPTPVSESTAAELKRTEGRTISFTCNDTIVAGSIVKLPNGSGLIKCVGADDTFTIQGIALYAAASGQRTTTIAGQVQCTWDGTGTPVPGSLIGVSTTQSGYFEVSATTSGTKVIGVYEGLTALVAANSGTMVPVRTVF